MDSLISKAIVVEIDLLDTLLPSSHHSVECAHSVSVPFTTFIRVVDRDDRIIDDEANLLGLLARRAFEDLDNEMSTKRNNPRSRKLPLCPFLEAKWAASVKCCEVQSRQSVEHDYLVSGIGVDALIGRKVCG